MKKIIIFQHAAQDLLGTLHPLIRMKGFKVRYVNFQRNPEEHPKLDKYQGLIIFGGHMGVYEAEKYPHLKIELKVIEEALKKDIPVLGICLGSQLLAQVLGSPVRKHQQKEIGWTKVCLTPGGASDSLFNHFRESEYLFQMHGDTFDIPKCAVHLATSEICPSQAFRFQNKVYGIQFHLEVDALMINRWLNNPAHKSDLESAGMTADSIHADTNLYLARSLELSRQTFQHFLFQFGLKEKRKILYLEHASEKK